MHEEFDLVIRGGTVHDGRGGPGRNADVGIANGRIAAVGNVGSTGQEEIDASGCIVTPGFVDLHTHYDGQAIWARQLTPSSFHGVTTVVMGNCGVGFAPCRAASRENLVELMEGVEDIPGPVLNEGLTWEWETFPEYLDVLARTHRDVDVCTLVPHAPVRVQVMGDRALHLAPATPEDIAEMRRIVAEGVAAGAFGVSTSRVITHQTRGGDHTPTLQARKDELAGLCQGMSDIGRGFFEVATDLVAGARNEVELFRDVLKETGMPGMFSLFQDDRAPDLYRELLRLADEAVADGVRLRPVVAPRTLGLLLGLEASQNPFAGTRTYHHELAGLPLSERVARMRDLSVRRRILSEDPMAFSTFSLLEQTPYTKMFRFSNPPRYTPRAESSLAAIAAAEGRSPAEVAYDALLEDDGMGLLYVPLMNYSGSDHTLSACEDMLAHPNTIMGLGDGGAHVGFILDASFQTFLLTYWVKERQRFDVGEAVRLLTSDPADAASLHDRGRIAFGMKADLNVIDLPALSLGAPFVAHDLPAGGRRLLQKAQGYRATVLSGVVTYRDSEPTGATPGRLVRSGAVSIPV